MRVTVTSRLDAYVKKQLESGEYASADALVEDALRLHAALQAQSEALRQDIEAGIRSLDAGDGKQLSAASVKAAVHRRRL
ncbi:MAG: type II toxin-antitoxin system ParD family antitoxin [Pannonibacter sp.]